MKFAPDIVFLEIPDDDLQHLSEKTSRELKTICGLVNQAVMWCGYSQDTMNIIGAELNMISVGFHSLCYYKDAMRFQPEAWANAERAQKELDNLDNNPESIQRNNGARLTAKRRCAEKELYDQDNGLELNNRMPTMET
ncbi:Protein of unknown function [Pyronema omphalodes CBS 100304]|uniref:Uncharacterized protein n=1 Tax=Pyronema omphalodes (strain CBS 100304) TaxID=1076935 RepID=U4KV28_PYROM|nr:Protein of unknown function [Pyronema omphalodes CBS 100304]